MNKGILNIQYRISNIEVLVVPPHIVPNDPVGNVLWDHPVPMVGLGLVACINKTQSLSLALRLVDTNEDSTQPPPGKGTPWLVCKLNHSSQGRHPERRGV
jgi:hypothetical protein